MLSIHTRQGHQGAVYDILWSSAHQSWFSCGGDGIVAQWTMDQANGTARLHTQSACYSLATWGDAGVVMGDASGGLACWSPSGVMEVAGHNAPVFALHERPDGVLLSGDGNGAIKGWRMGQKGLEQVFECATPHGKVRHFSDHPEGTLASFGCGGWGLLDANNTLGSMTVMHQGSCYWALWHEGKQAVFSGGLDGHLAVCARNAAPFTMPIHQSAVYRGVIHEGLLYTCSRDKSVKAWNIQDLEPRFKLDTHHARSVNAMALGGAKTLQLATGGDDKLLKVFNL